MAKKKKIKTAIAVKKILAGKILIIPAGTLKSVQGTKKPKKQAR